MSQLPIHGSGRITAQTRAVQGFDALEINLAADVALVQGQGERLRVLADDNLLEHIVTRVAGGRLIVETPRRIHIVPTQRLQLEIGFETLRTIVINGSSVVTGGDLDLESLRLVFNGTGSARLPAR
jgi:hypothetical protein